MESRMESQDEFSVRLYTDGQGGGWQLGYRGHYVRAGTKAAAIAALRSELNRAGIPAPPELDELETTA